MKAEFALAATAALCIAGGCIQVKTESEIKPIHKEMVDRQAAGITNRAMLEERTGATDDDRILIAEENAKRMKRFRDVAKDNGTTIEAVQKRYTAKMREKISAGAWYQDDAGKWQQKK